MQLRMTSSMRFHRSLTSGHLEIKWWVFSSASSQILQIPLVYFISFRRNSVLFVHEKSSSYIYIFLVSIYPKNCVKTILSNLYPNHILFYSNTLSTWFQLACSIVRLHIHPSEWNRLMISLVCWEYQIGFLAYQSHRLIKFLDECLTCRVFIRISWMMYSLP